jgi:hypothetical protein
LNGHPIRQIVKIEYCCSPLREPTVDGLGVQPPRSKNVDSRNSSRVIG